MLYNLKKNIVIQIVTIKIYLQWNLCMNTEKQKIIKMLVGFIILIKRKLIVN